MCSEFVQVICYMYNWYQFITHHSYIHKCSLQYSLYIALPLIFPPLLTWRPPAVTWTVLLGPRLLVTVPFVPHCSPLPLASFPSGLPRNPNVLLIRTHPNPSPSVANNKYALLYLLSYRDILKDHRNWNSRNIFQLVYRYEFESETKRESRRGKFIIANDHQQISRKFRDIVPLTDLQLGEL